MFIAMTTNSIERGFLYSPGALTTIAIFFKKDPHM